MRAVLLVMVLLASGAHSIPLFPTRDLRVKEVPPALKQTQYISFDSVREIIYNALEGIYMYNYISSGLGCVNSLNTYETDIQDMVNAFLTAVIQNPPNKGDMYEYTVFNLTNSIGMFSPILRNCYLVGG